MKSYISTSIVGGLLLSISIFVAPAAVAEECAKNDLTSIFIEEYYGDVKWDNRVGPKEITWSTEVSSVDSLAVTRKFSDSESAWLQESFDSWDIALDSISFKRIDDGQSAKIKVGLVAINENGFWTVEQRGDFRDSGTIKLSSTSSFLSSRSGFTEVAQSEIGNILGLGDISESFPQDSVMKDPDTAPFGSIPLSDFDIDLIRQFYGESTCRSSWSLPLKESKAKAAAAVSAAQSEATIKAATDEQIRLETESRAALSQAVRDEEKNRKARERMDRVEIATFKASLKGKVTITCVKGKLVKKVTGVRPSCPTGYKKR